MRKNNRAFTLIELLVAIIILSIITVVAVPNVMRVIKVNKNRAYVEDSIKLASHSEYLFKKDTNILKPPNGSCIVMSLDFLSDSLVSDSPSGNKYDKKKSFVLIKRDNDKYKYYVRLIDKLENNKYNGISFESVSNLSSKDSHLFVKDISNDKLFDIDGYSVNDVDVLSKLNMIGGTCNNVYVYDDDNSNRDKLFICDLIEGESTTWTNQDRNISVSCNSPDICNNNVFNKIFNYTTKKDSILVNTTDGKTTECFVNVYVDKDAPEKPNIVNPTNGNLVTEPFSLQVSSSDVGSGIAYWQYKYSNTDWISYNNSAVDKFTTTPFSIPRNEKVYIRACDHAGNCSLENETTINITQKNGWEGSSCKKYYQNNKYLVGWQLINNSWYYFKSDGCMFTGWLQDKVSYPSCTSGWWYFDSSGKMMSGWQNIGGNWYYLAKGDGKENKWQNAQPTGCMMTGWVYSEDYPCSSHGWYFDSSGSMLSNTTVDGIYKLDGSGCWIEKSISVVNNNYYVCPSDQNSPTRDKCATGKYDTMYVSNISVNGTNVTVHIRLHMNNTTVTWAGSNNSRTLCLANSSNVCVINLHTFSIGAGWTTAGSDPINSAFSFDVSNLASGTYRIIVDGGSNKFRFRDSAYVLDTISIN